MKKSTLGFSSLAQLVQFTKHLRSGYVLNTITLTLTAVFSEQELQMALKSYSAVVLLNEVPMPAVSSTAYSSQTSSVFNGHNSLIP